MLSEQAASSQAAGTNASQLDSNQPMAQANLDKMVA